MANKLPALDFGVLPYEQINLTLGLELEPGRVIMSARAQQHASDRHPESYPTTLPHVANVIANPLYMGDDFKNEGKIELIGRPAGAADNILVAVSVIRDDNGRYHVTSVIRSRTRKSNDAGRRAF